MNPLIIFSTSVLSCPWSSNAYHKLIVSFWSSFQQYKRHALMKLHKMLHYSPSQKHLALTDTEGARFSSVQNIRTR